MKKSIFGSGRMFGAALALACAFTAVACDDSDDSGGGTGGTGGAAAGAGGSAGAGGAGGGTAGAGGTAGSGGAGGGTAGAGGTAGSGGAGGAAGAPALKDIVDTAVAAGSFTKLAAALGAADLVTALKGTGPFTVFAPTDAAFNKLPAGTVDNLLKPENKAQLQAVLKYHVVSGKVPAATAITLSHATTLENKDIAITTAGNTVKINDATVTMADVQASNGVIHVIDTVLIPPSKDIVETAQGISTFSTLVAAVTAADLAATLKGTGPFTVFAPTNDAFAKLPAGTVDNLLKPENKAMLQAVLKYHVVAGKKYAGDVVKLTSSPTVQGPNVTIAVTGGTVKINTATVTQTNVLATNGVIHVIDTVLLPPSM